MQIYILVLDPQWPQRMTGNAFPFNLIGPDWLIDNVSLKENHGHTQKPGTQVGAQNKDFGAVSQTGPGSSKG